MTDPKPQNLVRLVGYPNWYQNPVSGELVFRKDVDRNSIKIFTGIIGKRNVKTGNVDGIAAARRYVEIELEKRKSEKTDDQLKRDREGVTDPLCDDLWNDMLLEKLIGKEDGTKANYHKDWKHGLQPFWGKKTVSQITRENIVGFKAWYITEKGDRLPEKTLDFFGMFMRYLVQQKYLAELPDWSVLDDLDEIIKKMKRYKKAGRVFSPVERQALLSAWKRWLEQTYRGSVSKTNQGLAARSRLMVALALLCGMRVMEIIKLKKSDIDFPKMIIRVWSQKNHKWREIPIVPYVDQAIRFQMASTEHLKTELLFPSPAKPSRPITVTNFANTWHQVRARAGIHVSGPFDARFHDLRKTCATMTAEHGWPLKVACTILDMSADVYLEIYANEVSPSIIAEFMLKTFSQEVDT